MQDKQPTPWPFTADDIKAALDARAEDQMHAKDRQNTFYGMKKDRPPVHDIVLYDAALAYLDIMLSAVVAEGDNP